MRAAEPIALALSSMLAAATASPAAETPFAVPPLTDPLQTSKDVSALSEIMGKVQMRHIKLWYAIKARSWQVLGYELGHLRDTFQTAVILYRNIPVELIVTADKPLAALQTAANEKNPAAAERAYAALTTSCNTCHEAAGIGFIHIHTPKSMPFSNQRFEAGE